MVLVPIRGGAKWLRTLTRVLQVDPGKPKTKSPTRERERKKTGRTRGGKKASSQHVTQPTPNLHKNLPPPWETLSVDGKGRSGTGGQRGTKKGGWEGIEKQ